MELTNRQQPKQDNHFCCKWKHLHKINKCKQQMMKVLEKHMPEKKDTKNQIFIKSQMHVSKINHYEHNTANGGIENEAPRA